MPRAALLAVVALLAISPAAGAATAGGMNTLEASAVGFVPFTLPADVTMGWRERPLKPSFRFEGNSRFPAVLFRRTEGEADWSLLAVRIGSEPDDVFLSYRRRGAAAQAAQDEEPGRPVLPAGEWRLYGFGDGSPLSVTFDLPGLSGEQRLHPTVPVPAQLADLPRADTLGSGPFAAWGAFGALESAGLMFAWMHAGEATDLGERIELCLHDGEASANPAAFYPGCGSSALNPTLVTGERPDAVMLASGEGAGTYGLGGNLTVLGPDIGPLDFTAAWVSFEPRPGVPILDMPAPAPTPAPIPQTNSGSAQAPGASKRAKKNKKKRCAKHKIRKGKRCVAKRRPKRR